MTKSHGHEGLHNIGEDASGEWKWQVRINLSDEFAAAARADLNDPKLSELKAVLDKHGVTLKNQFDAFANFCREMEEAGKTDEPLYKWTKDVIDRPGKEEQYATRFTVYQSDNQVYDNELANAVIADFAPFMNDGTIVRMNKISSDPAKNPQAPARFNR